MKVGTDGVLLGAWAQVMPAEPVAEEAGRVRVLDVGAGCGLISIMIAQRFPQTLITALEIDDQAALQAAENIAQSPFAHQVKVKCGDFAAYESALYDAIVSNPPFFEEDLLPPDGQRANARHTVAGLTFETLISRSAQLLRQGGSLHVVIPKDAQGRFHTICNANGLVLVHTTHVRTVVRKAPKRVLLHFVKATTSAEICGLYTRREGGVVERDEIVLMEDGKRSEAYLELCKDFYL